MRIQRRNAITVVDNDRFAIAAHPASFNHHAAVSRHHRIARIGADINTTMETRCAKNRMRPPAEGRRNLTRRRPSQRSRSLRHASAATAAAQALFNIL